MCKQRIYIIVIRLILWQFINYIPKIRIRIYYQIKQLYSSFNVYNFILKNRINVYAVESETII